MTSTAAALGVAASTGGIILGLAPIAQMRLVVARRSSEGVSIAYWCVLVAAMSLWLAYGIASGDLAIIAANTVTIAVALAMIAVLVRYRPRRTGHPAQPTAAETGAAPAEQTPAA